MASGSLSLPGLKRKRSYTSASPFRQGSPFLLHSNGDDEELYDSLRRCDQHVSLATPPQPASDMIHSYKAAKTSLAFGDRIYHYDPLPGPDHIRLLTLHPITDKRRTIHASLEVVDVHACKRDYVTLSYSWGRNSDGDASLDHEVLINNRILHITSNLRDALRRIRQRPRTSNTLAPLRLWIDAVCIDQSNVVERNAQVAILGAIYANAAGMTIWLGEKLEHDLGEPAFDAIWTALQGTEAVDARKGAEFEVLSIPAQWIIDAAANAGRSHPLEFLVPPGRVRYDVQRPVAVHHAWWKAIRSLLMSRYFFRRWVVQERFQSRELPITVRWGEYEVTMDELRTALGNALERGLGLYEAGDQATVRWPEYLQDAASEAKIAICDFRSMDMVADDANGVIGLDSKKVACMRMMQSLETLHALACSDDRDRLYSLAGICGFDRLMELDYGSTTVEVYVRFATALVQAEYCNNVLYAASQQLRNALQEQSGTSHIDGQNLPSWVPDLRYPVSFFSDSSDFHGEMARPSTVGVVGHKLRIQADVGPLDSGMLDETTRLSLATAGLDWRRLLWCRPSHRSFKESDIDVFILRSVNMPRSLYQLVTNLALREWPPKGLPFKLLADLEWIEIC